MSLPMQSCRPLVVPACVEVQTQGFLHSMLLVASVSVPLDVATVAADDPLSEPQELALSPLFLELHLLKYPKEVVG